MTRPYESIPDPELPSPSQVVADILFFAHRAVEGMASVGAIAPGATFRDWKMQLPFFPAPFCVFRNDRYENGLDREELQEGSDYLLYCRGSKISGKEEILDGLKVDTAGRVERVSCILSLEHPADPVWMPVDIDDPNERVKLVASPAYQGLQSFYEDVQAWERVVFRRAGLVPPEWQPYSSATAPKRPGEVIEVVEAQQAERPDLIARLLRKLRDAFGSL